MLLLWRTRTSRHRKSIEEISDDFYHFPNFLMSPSIIVKFHKLYVHLRKELLKLNLGLKYYYKNFITYCHFWPTKYVRIVVILLLSTSTVTYRKLVNQIIEYEKSAVAIKDT